MLTLNHLSKAFYQGNQPQSVVDNISLQVKKGQVFGFLGLNGAGKTTTVKMIVGLLFPDSGSITVNRLSSTTVESRAKVGFMPEQPQFYQHLQATEVLTYVGRLFSLPPEQLAGKAAQLLGEVGLGQSQHLPVRRFSKGMHQRLAFAVALMNDPELLILDEPLDGLDPLGRLDFKRLILNLKRRGKTVFFSSHILSDVEELCDEVAILHHGQIVAQGAPTKLVKKGQTLEEYFVEQVQ